MQDAAKKAEKDIADKVRGFLEVELLDSVKAFLDGPLTSKIKGFVSGDLADQIKTFCQNQAKLAEVAQKKIAETSFKSEKLEQLKADLTNQKSQATELIEFVDKLSPPDAIELSCRGVVIATSLKILKKIRGSKLEQIFSGKVAHGYDKYGRTFLDIDPAVFHHVLNYLSHDRTLLPPAEDSMMRKLVETEIEVLGLDKGLASPATLTTNVAKELQAIYNTKPCSSRWNILPALQIWNKKGPVKLSWIAENASVPIDLDDSKHKLHNYTTKEGSHWVIVNKKDGSEPKDHLYRSITADGTIEEGQDSEDMEAFCRIINKD